MNKKMFAVGFLSLFLSLAVLPICNASAQSSDLSNDDDSNPLIGPHDTFFVKAYVEGTVSGLQQHTFSSNLIAFKVLATSPIDLNVKATRGSYHKDYSTGGIFTAAFVKWDSYPSKDPSDPNLWHISGTVYLCHFYN